MGGFPDLWSLMAANNFQVVSNAIRVIKYNVLDLNHTSHLHSAVAICIVQYPFA